MNFHRWRQTAVLLLGAWLLATIVVFPSANTVIMIHFAATGTAIFLCTMLALIEPHGWETWLNLTLSVWTVLAPFVLQFSGQPAAWNSFAVGTIIGGLSLTLIVAKT